MWYDATSRPELLTWDVIYRFALDEALGFTSHCVTFVGEEINLYAGFWIGWARQSIRLASFQDNLSRCVGAALDPIMYGMNGIREDGGCR